MVEHTLMGWRMLRCVSATVALVTVASIASAMARGEAPGGLDAWAIVGKHVATFKAPPKQVPTKGMVDGPLLGNGDVGVTIGGPPETQTFFLSKNDFWRRNDASIIAIGRMTVAIPDLKGASYLLEQDLAHAEVRGTFTKDDLTLKTRTWVDANENLLVIEFTSNSKAPMNVGVIQVSGADKSEQKGQTDDASAFFLRTADSNPGSRQAAVVSRFLTGGIAAGGVLTATLEPGKTLTLVTPIYSDLDAKAPLEAAQKRAAELKPADVEALSKNHQAWWAAFWAKSFIDIPDKEIEKRWYAAQYVMACCSREGKIAPGLWGNWISTDHPNWHGDYHTNYNFQGPYYILYSSNHTDTAMSFYPVMMDQIANGQKMAQKNGWKGIHFPVSLGPWGLIPEGPTQDWGQRSDAVFCAMNFIWQYQYTQDLDFAKKFAYPFCLQCGDFWEDYLKLENGRYVIYSDAIHEGSGKDQNPLLSLGMVRMLFKNLIVMSKDLSVDEPRRAGWQEILDKLSAYPTQEMNGKTVFRYSEVGMKWNGGNTLGIHHIFPAGDIGLGSDPKQLEIARNMVEEMHRWSDGNGFCSWYTACARVGYDPKVILKNLRAECDKKSMPNLVLQYGGGGIENVSGFLVINEMMLQSYDGVLRIFPDWPRDMPAHFGTLRAVGAFLVSGEIKDGAIAAVIILSEKGKDCTVANPWPANKVRLTRNGKPAETFTGERCTFKTAIGETVVLEPVKE